MIYVALSQIAHHSPKMGLHQNLHLSQKRPLLQPFLAKCQLLIANAWIQVYLIASFLAAQTLFQALDSCAWLPC